MKIDYQAPVEAMHGRIENIIFQNYRRTHTARKFTYPREPDSPAQQAIRNMMTNANRAWQIFPQKDINLWIRFAEQQGGAPRTRFIGNYIEIGAGSSNPNPARGFYPPTTMATSQNVSIGTSGNNITFSASRPSWADPTITNSNLYALAIRTGVPLTDPEPTADDLRLFPIGTDIILNAYNYPNSTPRS